MVRRGGRLVCTGGVSDASRTTTPSRLPVACRLVGGAISGGTPSTIERPDGRRARPRSAGLASPCDPVAGEERRWARHGVLARSAVAPGSARLDCPTVGMASAATRNDSAIRWSPVRDRLSWLDVRMSQLAQ